ncbi:WD domain, Gbeta repeat-containing protein [Acanthamoeba castellanii str. Neff]|uniref:WD domain, Gbeta repeat-containing protein n=1 Tax=Acanthamoeba castellanii (strain ATCC 30010 / Neff) TaxID=1257118 RepID=L8GZ89_ACACF|nr:WD domain, Gbeta repeat-containing protein [Acanthamoeba castellanii str. Neff]ELR18267.1 WD domain, Gbeta repeat-containing protein [Acanthamoeba castellanii str. Neff]
MEALPDELHVHIFSFLTVFDLCRSVEAVCRQWQRLAGEASLWRGLMLADCRSPGRVRQVVEAAAQIGSDHTQQQLLLHHSSPHLLPSVLHPAASASPSSSPASGWKATTTSAMPHSGLKHWYRQLRAEERNWATGRYRTLDNEALRTQKPHHPGGCEYVDISGRYVVSGGWDFGLKIYDLQQRQAEGDSGDAKDSLHLLEPIKQIHNAHADGVLSVKIVGGTGHSLSEIRFNGQFLSCSEEAIALWDLESGALQKTFQIDDGSFVFADIDRHARFIAAGTEQGHLVVWKSEGEQMLKTSSWREEEKRVHEDSHLSMMAAAEEDLFSSHSSPPPLDLISSPPGSVNLFPPSFFTTSPASFISPPPSSPSSPLSQLSSSPTSDNASSASSPPRWRNLQLVPAHTKRTRVVHFPRWSDGELLVSASYDGMIALWRTEFFSTHHHHHHHQAVAPSSTSSAHGSEPRAFYHASDVVCLSSSESDPHLLFSGGFDCAAKLWDLRMAASPIARAKGAPPSSAIAGYEWKDITRRYYTTTLDCDDWKLIAGVGHQLWIWDRRKLGECMYTIDACSPEEEVWSARAWGPHLVTGSRDGYVRLIDFSRS